jgi:hypothetical protein
LGNIRSGSISALKGVFSFIVDESVFTAGSNYLVRAINFDGTVVDQSDVAFTIQTPSPILSIISPNGQEQLSQNTTQTITWDFENLEGSDQLVIEYSKDAQHTTWNQLISSSVSAFNGSYNWFVDGNKYAAANNYLIRIRTNDNSVIDQSDNEFAITSEVPASLLIESPNGGEFVELNSIVTVSWLAENFDSNEELVVEYSNDGGVAAWFTITNGSLELFDGKANWFVEATQVVEGTNYKVRVSTSDGSIFDQSENNFEIVASGPESITILSPNGGEQFDQNTSVILDFTSTGLLGSEPLEIQVSSNAGLFWSTISKGLLSSYVGKFTFELTAEDYVAGNEYMLRVITGDGTVVDQMDNTFGVTSATPKVVVTSLGIQGALMPAGKKNNVLYKFKYDITNASTNSSQVIVNFEGTAGANEFDSQGIKLMTNSVNDFFNASMLDVKDYSAQVIFDFDQNHAKNSTTYFWLLANVISTAQNSNFNIASPIVTDFVFGGGDISTNVSKGVTFVIEELVDQGLILTAPVGGEIFTQNTFQSITWNSVNFVGNEIIEIEYSADGGLNWITIITGSLASFGGKYNNWYLAETLYPTGSNYKVRVHTSNNSASTETIGLFEVLIPDPIITFSRQPVSGKNLVQGALNQIVLQTSVSDAVLSGANFNFDGTTTSSDFVTDGIKLYSNLSNNFASATLLGSATETGGVVTFVPNKPLIRDVPTYLWLTVDIASGATPASFNISTPSFEDFTITNAVKEGQFAEGSTFSIIELGAPVITLIAPNGGEELTVGSNANVQFSTEGFIGDELLNIDYSIDGGINWLNLSSNTVDGYAGLFSWQISLDQVSSSNYKLRVITEDEATLDESDGEFEIQSLPPSLVLLTPNGGQEIPQNTSYSIQWNSENFIGTETLVIEYSTVGGGIGSWILWKAEISKLLEEYMNGLLIQSCLLKVIFTK